MKKLLFLFIAIMAIISCKPTIEYRDKIVEKEVEKIIYVEKETKVYLDNLDRELLKEYFTYDFYNWEFEYPQALECYYIMSANIYEFSYGERLYLFGANIRKTTPTKITVSSNNVAKDTIDGFDYQYYSPNLVEYPWNNVIFIEDALNNSSEILTTNGDILKLDKKKYSITGATPKLKNRLYKNFRMSGKTFYSEDLTKFQINTTHNSSIFDEKTGITYYCTNSILDYLFDNNLFQILRVEGRKVIIKNFEQTIPLGFISSYTFTD